MIPKNVISCWFGRGKKSDLFLRCADSKRRVLHDWNFIDVTEDNCGDLMNEPHMAAIYARGEFAICPELARIWALNKYGGVSMDEDVEVLKPFDPLLEDEFFIGYEDASTLCGAVMGSVAGGMTIRHIWDNFPRSGDGSLKPTAYMPGQWLREIDCKKYPPRYFFPYLYNQKPEDAVITPDTYAIHHWAGSWKDYSWKDRQ